MPGDGKIEEFRKFMKKMLRRQDLDFLEFHAAISQGTKEAVRAYEENCTNDEVRKWLKYYLTKD
jgi:hypothetical protein